MRGTRGSVTVDGHSPSAVLREPQDGIFSGWSSLWLVSVRADECEGTSPVTARECPSGQTLL